MQQPRLVSLSHGEYELLEPLVYRWPHLGKEQRLTIPRGFRSSHMSVPHWCHWILARNDLQAAMICHDYLYQNAGRIPPRAHEVQEGQLWLRGPGTWTRQQSDRLWARMLRELGVSRFRRRVAYYGVRCFGGWAWGQRGRLLPARQN